MTAVMEVHCGVWTLNRGDGTRLYNGIPYAQLDNANAPLIRQPRKHTSEVQKYTMVVWSQAFKHFIRKKIVYQPVSDPDGTVPYVKYEQI
jgi:hypothetical protein